MEIQGEFCYNCAYYELLSFDMFSYSYVCKGVVLYMESSDDELLQLISPSFSLLDEVTQRQVYRSFYLLTYNMVLYIVQDYNLAQDVIQESFLKALKKKPHTPDIKHCKGWLKLTTKNLALNYLRKLKKNRKESDMDSVFILNTTPSSAESVENQVEGKLLKEFIVTSLNNLKPEYRVLIELRWQKQYSYQEIADELQTSKEIVQQKLHRARNALRKHIKDWMNGNER